MNRKILATVTAVVAGAVGVGAAVNATGDSVNKAGTPNPAKNVSAPDNLSKFSVLSSPATKADVVPAALHPDSLPVDSSKARQLVSNSEGTAWITADDKNLCLSVQRADGGGNAACNDTYTSVKGNAFTSGDPKAGVLVIGVAPDGVKQVDIELQDGTHQTVAVSGNGYLARARGATKAVSYDTADGPFSWPLPSFNN